MIEIPTPCGLLKISTGDLGEYNSVYIDLYTDKGKILPILQLEIPEPEVDCIQDGFSWRMPVPKGEPRIYIFEKYDEDASHLVTLGPDKLRIGVGKGFYAPEVIR